MTPHERKGKHWQQCEYALSRPRDFMSWQCPSLNQPPVLLLLPFCTGAGAQTRTAVRTRQKTTVVHSIYRENLTECPPLCATDMTAALSEQMQRLASMLALKDAENAELKAANRHLNARLAEEQSAVARSVHRHVCLAG